MDRIKASLAGEKVLSTTDAAGIILNDVRQKYGTWYVEYSKIAYKMGTFDWGDIWDYMMDSQSEQVDKAHQNCVQNAIQSILQNPGKVADKRETDRCIDEAQKILDTINELLDNGDSVNSDVVNILEFIRQAKNLLENGIKNIDADKISEGILAARKAVTEAEKVGKEATTLVSKVSSKVENITGLGKNFGTALKIIDLVISSGIDFAQYLRWTQDQKDLFFATLDRADDNLRLLEEIRSTFAADSYIVTYCNEVIANIQNAIENGLVTGIEELGKNVGAFLKVLLDNTVDMGVDLAAELGIRAGFNLIMKVSWGTTACVLLAGKGTGFLTELTLGTDTTIDNMDNIAHMYTDIERFIARYSDTIQNSSSVSDPVKAFGMLYVAEMKIVGLNWMRTLNKGSHKELADTYITSLTKSTTEIVNSYVEK